MELSSCLKNWSKKLVDRAFSHDGPAAPHASGDAVRDPEKWPLGKAVGFVIAASLLGWFVLLAPVYLAFAQF